MKTLPKLLLLCLLGSTFLWHGNAQSPANPAEATGPAAPPGDDPEKEHPVPEGDEKNEQKPKPGEQKIKIDLEGIQRRVVEFPTREGRFGRVLGCFEKKIFYSLYPIEGKLNGGNHEDEPSANGLLLFYDLEEQKEETFVSAVSDFRFRATANPWPFAQATACAC